MSYITANSIKSNINNQGIAGLYYIFSRYANRAMLRTCVCEHTKYYIIQSSLPPFLGLAKNRRYSETAVLGGSITLKLGIGRSGIGRGGIGRDDCINASYKIGEVS